MGSNDLCNREWDAWQEIVKQTKAGAQITEADWSAPLGRANTPGEKLIQAIKAWGDLRAELAVEYAKREAR